uniref:C2 domain-containing protein n=1 Tax=Macrostomum lignano TaxID=282301 RepID=A0A1I8HDA0_9PLAT
AKYLLRRRPSNMCTFYVALAYTRPGGSKEKRKTQLVSAACNPQFDRQFALPCTQEDAPESELHFKVKETVPVGKPHVIGHCAVQIAALLEMGSGGHEIWRELQQPVALAADTDSKRPPGRILLSLSYKQQKKLLTLGIVEGKDLRVKETDSYVYFRASIMAREQTVKAKKSPLIKENLASPLVQQEFRFHLAPNLTDQVYLFVLICARSRLGANRLLGKA